jgi:methyl-accepting chemotaxis protein
MNIPKFKSNKSVVSDASVKKGNQELTEYVSGMRDASRKALTQSDKPMDTLITAGGTIGGSVKAIERETEELHNKISSASSALNEIMANVRQFSNIIEKQNSILSKTVSAMDKMSKSESSVAEITSQKM